MKDKKKLGEILLEMGVLKKETLELVLSKQKKIAKKLGDLMLDMKLLSKADLVEALAQQCELPFLKKLPEKPDIELGKLIPLEFMERYELVPFELSGDRLKVATINPQSLLFIDNLRLSLKREIDLHFTIPEEFTRLVGYFDRARVYFPESQSDISKIEEKEKGALIHMVRHVVLQAMKQRASDIHLETSREQFTVRYRIDGILHPSQAPPKELSPQVVSRIKVLAGMDLAEKRLPQDGRIRFEADNQWVDLRVSIIPSLHGESVVLRVLQRRNLKIGLGGLGFSERHSEIFRSIISLPYGMVFVTGPTGSGKTTTLYAALETLNQPGEKIITVEDPIEYELDGVNQVQVKPEINLQFSHALRAMLRQAPTIILVGEIRDQETAEIAVQAALTGHLVFSTLHTNDAISAIPRLVDLGIKPYLVAAATQGIIAQRLVRKICSHCKVKVEDAALSAYISKRKLNDRVRNFYLGKGCANCHGTGYSGRIAIFEMFYLNEEARTVITKDGGSIERLRPIVQASGMESIFHDGLDKVNQGVTTLEEVLRVVEGNEDNA